MAAQTVYGSRISAWTVSSRSDAPSRSISLIVHRSRALLLSNASRRHPVCRSQRDRRVAPGASSSRVPWPRQLYLPPSTNPIHTHSNLPWRRHPTALHSPTTSFTRSTLSLSCSGVRRHDPTLTHHIRYRGPTIRRTGIHGTLRRFLA